MAGAQVPIKQVARIEPWKEPHKTRNGVIVGVVILGGLVIAMLVALSSTEFAPDY